MGSKAILLLGLVLGLIAAALAYTQVKEEEVVIVGQEFMKLNADYNLAAGDRLQPNMVSAVTIPLEFSEVQSVAVAYTPEVEAWLANNDVRVSRDILAGSFILHEHVLDDPEVRFASIISEKGRAVTIPASEITSVGYFIEPGSRVDILTTLSVSSGPSPVSGETGISTAPANVMGANAMDSAFGAVSSRVVTRTIMQNMQVLAVGNATTRNAYLKSSRGYSSITLDVTPEEAEMLTFLMSQGDSGFNLVLRNPVNTSEQDIADVDWRSVTEQ